MQENNSSRHNSVTAAVANVQTTSYRKPRPKSKTSDISKQSPSKLHHTVLLGRARFTAQPLSALVAFADNRSIFYRACAKFVTQLKRFASPINRHVCRQIARVSRE